MHLVYLWKVGSLQSQFCSRGWSSSFQLMAVKSSLGNFLNVYLRWYQRAIGHISTMGFYSLKVKINIRIQPRTYAAYLIVIPAQTIHELFYSLCLHLGHDCF